MIDMVRQCGETGMGAVEESKLMLGVKPDIYVYFSADSFRFSI